MRWNTKPYPKHRDIRIVSKFALFPIWIDGEYRWLERVSIQQRYFSDWDISEWDNIKFIDEL